MSMTKLVRTKIVKYQNESSLYFKYAFKNLKGIVEV